MVQQSGAQETDSFQTPDLEDGRIYLLPDDAFYFPNFITAAEEEFILSQINSPTSRWRTLTHRRLQTHPSPLSANNVLVIPPQLPDWLITSPPVLERFAKIGLFQHTPHKAPNHVLINEYKPGQGIMPHEDGGAYAPVVATISLGATIVLDIYDKNQDEADQKGFRERQPKWRILQEPRSLLVTTGQMYTDYLHGIADVELDEEIQPPDRETGKGIVNWDLLGKAHAFADSQNVRGTRVSLTYRDVPKVKDMGKSLRFLPQNKR